MATTKRRINISIGSDIEKMLGMLAKRDSVPQATKVTELLRVALELEEDRVWAAVVGTRDTKKARFVSHEKAWA